MRVLQISDRAVAIWFTGEPCPTRSEALALVRSALSAAGRAPWPKTAAEQFTAGDETLLIARPGSPERLTNDH